MRRSIIIPIIIVVVIVAVVVALLGRGGSAVPSKILVGVPAPQTGIYSGFGAGGVWGMQAAVADINALGGIYVEEYGKNLTLELVIRDTESDDAKAGSIAESLILTDKVHFLAYGDQPPPMNAAIATKAQTHKIPYICTTGPAEPWLAMRGEAPGNGHTPGPQVCLP